MATHSAPPDIDEGERAADDPVVESAQRALDDTLATAERVITQGMQAIRSLTRDYSGPASDRMDEAQRFIVERVKERPVTATLAGLGIGVLIGLLLSGRGK